MKKLLTACMAAVWTAAAAEGIGLFPETKPFDCGFMFPGNDPTCVRDITNLDEIMTFRGNPIAEIAKFLVFGFGTEYNSRIVIKPWVKMDYENKRPRATLVYWQLSF